MFSHLTKETEKNVAIEQLYWEMGCINLFEHMLYCSYKKLHILFYGYSLLL